MNSLSSVISIEDLHFGYSLDQLILDRLHLEVPKGAVYGFLGANGAGKSTTIRSILGLLKPQKGSIRLFGKEVRSNRLEVLGKVGSLIESPSIYPHLSGYDNLKIVCTYLNVPKQKIEEVLELVNLRTHSRKTAKKYSTGMKQRLGMAMALLSDPELLILDEPTNGLDPTGMVEFRSMLQQLHDRGKTIFISSHLLGEIEKIATHVGILKGGTILFQGTIGALEHRKGSQVTVRLSTSDNAKTLSFLEGKVVVEKTGDTSLELQLDQPEDLPKIVAALVAQDIQLYEVNPLKNDLEKLFLNLTQA